MQLQDYCKHILGTAKLYTSYAVNATQGDKAVNCLSQINTLSAKSQIRVCPINLNTRNRRRVSCLNLKNTFSSNKPPRAFILALVKVVCCLFLGSLCSWVQLVQVYTNHQSKPSLSESLNHRIRR